MKKIKPNVHCQWHQLKTVCLGNTYAPEFYEAINDSELRDLLQRIAYETLEDYQNINNVLKELGVDVIRQTLDPNDSIINHVEAPVISPVAGVAGSLYKRTPIDPPPMCPRDHYMILGNQLLYTTKHSNLGPIISGNVDSKYIINPNSYELLGHKNYIDENYEQFWAPAVTRVGKDLFVDLYDFPNLSVWFKTHFPEYRVHTVKVGGHNDGVFSPVKPGLIISCVGFDHYKETFPGWEVCYLEGESWEKVNGWWDLKKKNRGKWWVPGEESNKKLIEFVNTWLNDWMGYVEESVFDVNVLVINEKQVLVSNYNKQAFEAFKRHGMEPIIVPWRHRYFWDGGLHCITLDLERDGEMEDCFPHMKDEWKDL
jgi:hypothetical protein